jgi:hypothetical protein
MGIDLSKMPKNSKNSKNGPKGNSFELLSESNNNESITIETTSAGGSPLKRTQTVRTQLTSTSEADELDQSHDTQASINNIKFR